MNPQQELPEQNNSPTPQQQPPAEIQSPSVVTQDPTTQASVQQPVPVMPPQQSGQSPASAPMSSGMNNNKSKIGLVLGIVGGVLVLIVVALVLCWFMLWSPAAQSKRLSNSFMHAITSGDVTKASDLTGDASSNDFLKTASPKVNGTYQLSQSKFSNDTGYYLYTLSGATDKYARTVIEKNNGKRVVHSFAFSNTQLALVPSSSAANTTTTATTNSAPSTPAPSDKSNCLAANDYSFFSNLGGSLPTPNSDGTFSDFYQLEFSPDVATYAPGASPDPTTVFNDFKNFYAQNANKKYDIKLEASVNSTAPDEQLANARNNKVQSDLESISGIPASKITIQPITNGGSGTSDPGDAFYRQVQISLMSAQSCSSQN